MLGEHPVSLSDGAHGVSNGHRQRQRNQDQEHSRTEQKGTHDHPEPENGDERRTPEAAISDRGVTRDDDRGDRDVLGVVSRRVHPEYQQQACCQRVAPSRGQRHRREQHDEPLSSAVAGQAGDQDEHSERCVGIQRAP